MGDGRLKIGVSACLLGHPVRFDGGHKQSAFVTTELASIATLVPVCPELALGLGAPRESLRLERREGGPRLVAPRSGTDHTEAMRRYAEEEVARLGALDLHGFVVKKGSPSCGLERVKLYGAPSPAGTGAQAARSGVGLFTATLRERLPLLPVEEEGRLQDPALRDAFLTRIHAVARARSLLEGDVTPAGLMAFHAREKLLLLAYRETALRELGRLVAQATLESAPASAREYASRFLLALSTPPTRGRHVNVLRHVLGHFRARLEEAVRGELTEAIDAYREGHAPRDVPVALLGHYVRRFGLEWLALQTYFAPYPRTLVRHGWS